MKAILIMSRAFLFAALISLLPACAMAQDMQQGRSPSPNTSVRPPTGPIGATGTGQVIPPTPDGPHDSGAFYPQESRRAFEEGDVIVNFIVNIDGSVSDVVVASSSGAPRLDAAAIAAVSTWRYHPATQGGTVVAYRVNAMLRFRLNESMTALANFTVIEAPPDAYPQDAFLKRQQGATTVAVLIDESGHVLAGSLLQSSGVPSLDQASLNLVNHRWSFVPASVEGKSLKCFFYLIVNWTLPPLPPKPKGKGDKPV